MIVHAAAALPDDDRERATEALREQLCVMVNATRTTADWSTFTVTGPDAVPGAVDGARFEWSASVSVDD